MLASRAGVTAAEVAAVTVGEGGDLSAVAGLALAPRETAMLTAVDRLVVDRTLDDDAWSELARYLDERELIEFLLLVGHYDMLATTINTLRIEPDGRRRA